MRALLLLAAALCVLAVPATDAAPPGGGCQVQEEYVTHAHTSGSILNGDFRVEPGARRPIECYY